MDLSIESNQARLETMLTGFITFVIATFALVAAVGAILFERIGVGKTLALEAVKMAAFPRGKLIAYDDGQYVLRICHENKQPLKVTAIARWRDPSSKSLLHHLFKKPQWPKFSETRVLEPVIGSDHEHMDIALFHESDVGQASSKVWVQLITDYVEHPRFAISYQHPFDGDISTLKKQRRRPAWLPPRRCSKR